MIHITKSGFKHLEWDSDTRTYVEEPFQPIQALREGVTKVEEDVTLGDVLLFVANDPVLRIFFSDYSSCPVEAFAQAVIEARTRPVQARPDKDKVDFCTVSMCTEVDYRRPGKYKVLADKELTVSMEFHGVTIGGTDNWSLSLSPMSEIATLPFRLTDSNMACTNDDREETYTFDRVENLHYCPSLLELLDAILFDISFHGGPEETADALKGLQDMAKEVIDGTAKTIPFDLLSHCNQDSEPV